MTYSYTQISQYLTCPRRYRHRYLDGWQEKDTAPPCSSAAASNRRWRLFRHEDPAAVLFEQWALQEPGADLLRQRHLGQMFTRVSSCSSALPRTGGSGPSSRHSAAGPAPRNLSSGNSFVAFVDAIGELDSTPFVLEWKTSSARYPE